MANVELLKEKISNSGMTVTAIADKSGILRETLYNRMKSGNFYASEITALTRVLHLTRKERDEIFFALISELNSQKRKKGDGK